MESQNFSEVSSNLDGILTSEDFVEQEQMGLIDSNLSNPSEARLVKEKKQKRDSLKNTAEKFMKKSKGNSEGESELPVSSGALERQLEESLELELSKMRESQNKVLVGEKEK